MDDAQLNFPHPPNSDVFNYLLYSFVTEETFQRYIGNTSIGIYVEYTYIDTCIITRYSNNCEAILDEDFPKITIMIPMTTTLNHFPSLCMDCACVGTNTKWFSLVSIGFFIVILRRITFLKV